MANVPPFKMSFIDESNRIYIGSNWFQSVTYLAAPTIGQFIAEIIDVPSADIYSVNLIGGQSVPKAVPLSGATYLRGNYVLVERLLGVWTILSLAVKEDISGVTRAHMQIRDKQNGILYGDLDSANSANKATLGFIDLAPISTETSFSLNLPFSISSLLPAFTFKYDLFFYYGSTDRRIRQYGTIQTYESITIEVP